MVRNGVDSWASKGVAMKLKLKKSIEGHLIFASKNKDGRSSR